MILLVRKIYEDIRLASLRNRKLSPKIKHPPIKSLKKNTSIENFMILQWSWTI